MPSSARASSVPIDVRITGLIMTVVICAIGWQVYLTRTAPIVEYTLEKDNCCRIMSVAANDSQWYLARLDGSYFGRIDWCTGPSEYDPKNWDARPGLVTRLIRFQDKGCKSTALVNQTGIVFEHNPWNLHYYTKEGEIK